MAYSTQSTTSDGTLVLLALSLEYFDRSEISVFFNGEINGFGWAWVGSTEKAISFPVPIPINVVVTVKRITNIATPRHLYDSGAAFTSQSIDESFLQIMHIAQESREGSQVADFYEEVNMHGLKIVGLGAGAAPGEAVEFSQLTALGTTTAGYATAASGSASAALVSQNAAAASAASAASSAELAASYVNSDGSGFTNLGHTVAFGDVAGVNLVGSGDVTSLYTTGRRVRIMDAGLPVYGYVTSSNFITPDTYVNLQMDTLADLVTPTSIALGAAITGKPVSADGISVVGAAGVIRLGIESMHLPTTTPAGLGIVEVATSGLLAKTLNFNDGAYSSAQFSLRLPGNWNGGYISLNIAYSSTTTGSSINRARMLASFVHNTNLQTAFSTPVVNLLYPTAVDTMVYSQMPQITLPGGAGTDVFFRLARDGAHGDDTFAGVIRVHAIYVRYWIGDPWPTV